MTDPAPYTPPAVAPDPNVGASIRSVQAVNPKARLDIIEPGLHARYSKHLADTGGHEQAAIARLEREQAKAAQDLRIERNRRMGQPDNPLQAPLPDDVRDFSGRHLAAVMQAAEIDPDDPVVRRLMADLEVKGVRRDLWPPALVRFAQQRQIEARWKAETDRILTAGGVAPDDPEYRDLVAKHKARRPDFAAWVQDIARLALRRLKQADIPAGVVALERGARAAQGAGAAETTYRREVAAASGDWRRVWEAKQRARAKGYDIT